MIFSGYDFYKHLRRLTYGYLLFIAATPLQAQSLLTMEEVVQHVLAHNFDIQIARNNQKIATKNHHVGKAGFLPTLDARSYVDKEYQTWPKKSKEGTRLSTDVGLRWTVFNGMQRIFTYKQLGKKIQISQLEVKQKIEEKVAEAIIGYYSLALAQQKKHVLENGLSVSKEVLQLAKVKYEVGKCSKLEYLNAQVQHNEEQEKLLSQEEVLTAAKLTLHSLLGKDGPEEFSIAEDIPLPEKLIWEMLYPSSTAANTSILLAQKHCEDATLAIKMKRADLWPSVDLSLGYSLGSKRHDQHWEATPRGFKYGMSISFNLFNAFQHITKIQETSIKADNAQLDLRAQQLQLESELKKQFLHYTQQLQRYALAQQHVQVSQENVAVALAQYRLGSITLLVLNKARQNEQETTLKCWQVLYNAKVAEVELQKLAGTLLDAVILGTK